MATVNLKLYDLLRKELHLSDDKAREFVFAFDEAIKEEIKLSKTEYKSLVKEDFSLLDNKLDKEIHRLELKLEQTKGELTKAIFWTSLIQFLAIVGSVIGIINFMMHK